MISRIVNSVINRGFFGMLNAAFADFMDAASEKIQKRRDHQSKFQFINRSQGHKRLVIVLAGYKPYLWPTTMARLMIHIPKDHDVCIASSGIYNNDLEALCKANHWSYLSTSKNSPGIALNISIKLHESADYTFKLDEDIIVGRGFFENLYDGYVKSWKSSLLEPGFCAPVLNVNGITYKILLESLRLSEVYKEKFGELITRCGDLPVHYDPQAALWLWENILPFDEKATIISNQSWGYTLCGTRFSIGAILLRRDFIKQIGGFKSAWQAGVLGVDEDMLCRDCMSMSRPIHIINNILAGHFSFYPQEETMRDSLSLLSKLDPITFPTSHYGKQ